MCRVPSSSLCQDPRPSSLVSRYSRDQGKEAEYRWAVLAAQYKPRLPERPVLRIRLVRPASQPPQGSRQQKELPCAIQAGPAVLSLLPAVLSENDQI